MAFNIRDLFQRIEIKPAMKPADQQRWPKYLVINRSILTKTLYGSVSGLACGLANFIHSALWPSATEGITDRKPVAQPLTTLGAPAILVG